MTCSERRDLILLWVMGQLESQEADELRQHVASGCSECAGYLAEAREVELSLLLAPDPAEPPPSLETRLLERLRPSEGGVPRAGAPGRPWRWAAAAALTAMVAGALGYRLGDTDPAADSAVQEQLDEADVELAELEARVAALEGLLEEASEQVALLRAPDVQRLELAGTDTRIQASARMFWQWQQGYYCYLHAEGLAAPAPGAVYALWMENEAEERLLVGTFRPDRRGQGLVWAKLPVDTGRAVRAMVTLEQGEPGQEPAGPLLLASR